MSEITTIQAMLDELVRLQAIHTALANKVRAMKEAAIPEAVRQHLAAIDEEHSQTLQLQLEHIQALDMQVRINVLVHGSSVKGRELQAVWNKGRVKWNDKALDGYAAAHAELLQFRTEGEPSVTIRAAKQSTG